jgi:dTDP-4-dehydrorhamnose reductase
VITGGTGTLGRAFARVCQTRGLPAVLLGRREMDIAVPKSVVTALERYRPWAVVNAAGYVRVDDAEADADRCRRENAAGPAVLAAACGNAGVRLVTFSSDLVFDGRSTRPYREDDPVAPLNVYGATKAEAERRVSGLNSDALVIRTSAFFGPWDEYNFASRALRTLRGGALFPAADDLTVSPSYVPDLCHAALDLLIDGEAGVWHLAGPDPVTWADLAWAVAERAGVDPTGVLRRPAASFGWPAPRPTFSALGSNRGPLLPSLSDSLDRFVRDLGPGAAA